MNFTLFAEDKKFFVCFFTVCTLLFGFAGLGTTYACEQCKSGEHVDHDANATVVTASPEACVQSLHDALLSAMKLGEDASCGRRYEMLEPVLNKLFDFELTSRLVLGRYWKKLSPEKRKEFVKAFSRMSTAVYAERFKGFAGEDFRIVETVRQRKNRSTVKSIIITSKGEKIPLDYTCVLHGSSWKIVTVTARGVNDLAMKRSEYTSYLKNHTIDELISFVNEQVLKCTGKKTPDKRK